MSAICGGWLEPDYKSPDRNYSLLITNSSLIKKAAAIATAFLLKNFFDLSGFTRTTTQIVKFSAADSAFLDDFNSVDLG